VGKETRAFFAPGQAELLRVAFPAAFGRDNSQFLCWILKDRVGHLTKDIIITCK
jgi:hypothetical protein